METFLKVVLGVLVGGVLLIAGCFAVVSIGVNEVSDDLQESSDVNSITMGEFESAETGETTLEEVEARFGEPVIRESDLPEDPLADPEAGSVRECVFYNQEGELTAQFSFCFDDDGVLESKESLF